MIDLTRFPIHHLGIAVTANDFKKITMGKNINSDKIQGVDTYFEHNSVFNCYVEYFTISGRAKNYKPGFNHVCYSLNSEIDFEEFKTNMIRNNYGIQLTKIESSGSKECNKVVFCFLSGIGIVEFNINE